MDSLKNFVKTAVNDIVCAVVESGRELNRDIYVGGDLYHHTIQFDIAVTAEDGKEGVPTRIRVGSSSVGEQAAELKSAPHMSRIKFEVEVGRLDAKRKKTATAAEVRGLGFKTQIK